LSHGTALAAMLEAGTSVPILIGWGDFLLAEALHRGYAQPLLTGGPAPAGYWLKGDAPGADLVSEGLRRGEIDLDCTLKTASTEMQPAGGV
jgi:hypothetical protein